MPFKFNFNSESESVDEQISETVLPSVPKDAVFIEVEDRHFRSVSDVTACEIQIGERLLKHVSSQEVEEKVKQMQNQVSRAINDSSDLIPNIYEGGLKIWECSVDLANFLAKEEIPLEGRNILEVAVPDCPDYLDTFLVPRAVFKTLMKRFSTCLQFQM